MEKAEGRPVQLHEIFRQLHYRRDTNEPVDRRTEETTAVFEQAMNAFVSKAQKSGHQLTPEEMAEAYRKFWTEAAGGFKKNRLYGAGSLALYYNPCSAESSSSQGSVASASSSVDSIRMSALEKENTELKEKFGVMSASQEELKQQVQSMMGLFLSQQVNARPTAQFVAQPQPQFQVPLRTHYQPPLQPQIPPQYHQFHPIYRHPGSFVATSHGLLQTSYPGFDLSQPPPTGSQVYSPSHMIRTPSGSSPYQSTPSGSGSHSYPDNTLSTPGNQALASAAGMPNAMDFFSLMGDMQNGYRPGMPPSNPP